MAYISLGSFHYDLVHDWMRTVEARVSFTIIGGACGQ